MHKNPVDNGHHTPSERRLPRYSLMERIRAGEAGHPSVRLLTRRKRRGLHDASRVKQFLRIERGYLA